MAYFQGIQSGFTPSKMVKPKVEKKVDYSTVECEICKGIFLQNDKKLYVGEPYCACCSKYFGYCELFGGGVTNVSPRDSIKKITEAKERGYCLMLKTQGFYGVSSGVNFTIERGDIFKISRSSLEMLDDAVKPSMERTKAIFTIDINVGGEALTLFPHEFGSLSFLEVMELKSDGAYIEDFVHQDDKEGYFKPTDDFKPYLDRVAP